MANIGVHGAPATLHLEDVEAYEVFADAGRHNALKVVLKA